MTVEMIDVVRRFGATPALEGVSLTLREGEFTALLGPSGSGKTTFLRVLAGLEGSDSGTIRIAGQDVTRVAARERGIGMMFQSYALFRHMTVFENVAFGLRVRRRRPPEAEISARVRRLLDMMQVSELERRYPAQISGGQRQRVALARALAIEPRLLLLDEPFSALDALVRKEVRRWLRGLHDQLGITTVLVTHDQEEAMELADSIAVMERGRIAQFDTAQRLLSAPATPFVAAFVGEAARLDCEVRNGMVRFANEALGSVCADLQDGPATAFARAGDVFASSGGGGARVVLVRETGGGRRILVVQAGDAVIDATGVEGEHLSRGDTCGLTLRGGHLFASNGSRVTIVPPTDPA